MRGHHHLNANKITHQFSKRTPSSSSQSVDSPFSEKSFQHLGRELYDGVGQTLWFVSLQTQLLEKNLQLSGAISRDLWRQLQHISTMALNEVCALIDLLDSSEPVKARSPVDFGSYLRCESDKHSTDAFPLALNEYLHTLRPEEIQYDFEWSSYFQQSHWLEAHLFRIAQGAVSNAIRHARAQHIYVKLSIEGTTIWLRVQDDGQGICKEKTTGYGLKIMQERVTELKGKFIVSSVNPHGTLIEVGIPQKQDLHASDNKRLQLWKRQSS